MSSRTGRFTGKSGHVEIDGQRIDVTMWDAEESTDYDDTTDTSDFDATEQRSFKTEEPGDVQLKGSVKVKLAKADWYLGIGDPPVLRAGRRCAMKLHFDAANYINVPVANITNVKTGNGERKKSIEAEIQFTSWGIYQLPTTMT